MSLASQIKLALLVTAYLWMAFLGLLTCFIGAAFGGGLSPTMAVAPAFAILLAAAHTAVGKAQQRWTDVSGISRLRLSVFGTTGFALGWAILFVLKLENVWLVCSLPTTGCLACLGAAILLPPRAQKRQGVR